jgi:hypothetical protein
VLVGLTKQVHKLLELMDFLKVVVGALKMLFAVLPNREHQEQPVFTADLGVALPLLLLVVELLLAAQLVFMAEQVVVALIRVMEPLELLQVALVVELVLEQLAVLVQLEELS